MNFLYFLPLSPVSHLVAVSFFSTLDNERSNFAFLVISSDPRGVSP